MCQWQNYMTTDWKTYDFVNRQAAYTPVRRRPQPPSPHHGVSASRLLAVPPDPGRSPLKLPSISHKITAQSHSPLTSLARKPQLIKLPVSMTSSTTPTKPHHVEPLQLNKLDDTQNTHIQSDELKETPKFDTLPTGRRIKPRKKLGQ